MKLPAASEQMSTLETPKRPEKRTPTRRVRGLDGLRALAAGAVLAYHLVPHSAIGGFLGVDVFFVLSGFLITALLVREHAKYSRINLKSFWLRRIRRLLPAVALMAVITLIVAGLVNTDLLAGILPQFLGVVTFSYNWVEIARGASYFDTANPHLWTNVWSLAVEQQFYLFWPLIILGLVYIRKKYRWLLPAALAIASSIWMAVVVSGASDFTRAYQGTDTHAFGLMVGAVVAVAAPNPLGIPRDQISQKRVRVRGYLAWISLAIVVITWFTIPDDKSWVYPWGTLIAVIATAGLIQGFLPEVDERPGPGRTLASILEVKPLVWLGHRSYGIYLWHWPIWVILSKQFPTWPVWVVAVVVVVTSTVAAALSFKYVEQPMRQDGIGNTIKRWLGPSWDLIDPKTPMPKDPQWKQYRRIMAPGLIAVVIVGSVIGFLLSAPDKTSAEEAVERGRAAINQTEAPAAEATKPPAKATEPPAKTTPPAKKTPFVAPTGDHITVIGDSVTVASAPALTEKLPGIDINGEVSRSIDAGIPLLQQYKDEGKLRPWVVVALASNSQITPENLDQVLKIIGPDRRLILVTGFGPARTTWIDASNATIRDWAPKHPDQVRIADWAAGIKDHTDLLADDFVHPGAEGGQIYAQAVVAALNSFGK